MSYSPVKRGETPVKLTRLVDGSGPGKPPAASVVDCLSMSSEFFVKSKGTWFNDAV